MKTIDFQAIKGGKKSGNKAITDGQIEAIRNSLPELLEYMAIRAELKRNYYSHLIEQGFTKSEALRITAEDTTL